MTGRLETTSSTTSSAARPMLPTSTVGIDATSSVLWISVAVVDFPLLPVTPIRARPASRALSTNRTVDEEIGTPVAAAAVSSGCDGRIPGDLISKSRPDSAASRSVSTAHGNVPSRSSGRAEEITRTSRQPRRRSQRTAERPSTPYPKTAVRVSVPMEVVIELGDPPGGKFVIGREGQSSRGDGFEIGKKRGDASVERRHDAVRNGAAREPREVQRRHGLIGRTDALERLRSPNAEQLLDERHVGRIGQGVSPEQGVIRRVIE